MADTDDSSTPAAGPQAAEPRVKRRTARHGARQAPTELAKRGPTPEEWPPHERAVIDAAMAILRARLKARRYTLDSADAVRAYLTFHAAELEHECFGVLFLDAQHRLIAHESMFRGSLAHTSVYPREVVKAALKHNAGAVILTHNHPSGVPEPSKTDENLTHVIRHALSLIDVRVLDHIVTAGDRAVSLAERGLM